MGLNVRNGPFDLLYYSTNTVVGCERIEA